MSNSVEMDGRLPRLNSFNDHKRPATSKISAFRNGSVKVRVKITPEDIGNWRQSPCSHPLAEVLRRTTHTNWRMIDSILLAEREPPFHTVFLGTNLMLQLLDCKNGYGPDCLECEVELLLPFCE
jgi:hypothetical protein